MNKWDYLKKLEAKISILEEKERKKVIKEYEAKIEEKVKKGGKTEEEAVKSLGDVDKVAKKVLKDHKISEEYVDRNHEFEGVISRFINYIVEITRDFISKLEKKDFRAVTEIIIYILIGMFAFWVLRIPFYIVEVFGHSIFNIIYTPLGQGLNFMWSFIINVCYILLVIWIVVIILNKVKPNNEKLSKEKTTEKKKENKTKAEETPVVKKTNVSLDVFTILVKVLIIIMMLPLIFVEIGLFIGVGGLIFLLIEGVALWGPILILVGLIIMLGVVIDLIFYLTFNRGGRRK